MDFSNISLETLRSAITITSLSNDELEFSWKVVEVGSDYLEIQLEFKNPLQISRDGLDSFSFALNTESLGGYIDHFFAQQTFNMPK